MTKLLQLNSSILADKSVSTTLADRFVAQYREQEPQTEVTVRDLAADPIPHFDGALIQALGTPADERSADQQARVALADRLIAEVQDADVLVIAAPMYNFTVPTQLKAWFDQIARAGTTFRYTETGPEGLLTGKRAYVMTSRGGVHAGQPSDFVTGYVRQFLAFVGITDVTFVFAEGTNLGGDARADGIAAANTELERLLTARAA